MSNQNDVTSNDQTVQEEVPTAAAPQPDVIDLYGIFIRPVTTPEEIQNLNRAYSLDSLMNEVEIRTIEHPMPTGTAIIQSTRPAGICGMFSASTIFSRSKSVYQTVFNNKFYKCPVATEKVSDSLYRFKKHPGILREGFVNIDGSTYYVSVEDLRRGVVRAYNHLHLTSKTLHVDDILNGNAGSREYARALNSIKRRLEKEQREANRRSKSSTGTAEQIADPASSQYSEESDFPIGESRGPDSRFGIETDENELGESAFTQQVGALLHLAAEEGWELEDPNHP